MPEQDAEQRPTHAESARSMLVSSDRATLSTLDVEGGYPYGSIAEYLALDDGDAVFFLSDLAEHTANFKEDPRASLFIAPGMAENRPLALERLTLIGQIEKVDDRDAYREAYLNEHPDAAVYIDFSDFSFWRLKVERLRYIAGFGRMGWVDLDEYRSAEPDPLAEMAGGAIEHMNDDHADALADYARAFTDAEDVVAATMVGLDRFGFDMQVRDSDGREQRKRVHFDPPVEHPSKLRKTMAELAHEAREQLG